MKKNNLFLAILIIVIIIEICTSAILLLYKRRDEGQIISPSSLEHKTDNKELAISNPSELIKLDTASISKSEIVHVLNEYVTSIFFVSYSNINSTEEQLKKVYENNEYEYQKCGLNSYKDLYSVIDIIKDKNIDFNEYESIQFNETNVEGNQVIISTSVMYKSGKFIKLNLKYIDGFVDGIEVK